MSQPEKCDGTYLCPVGCDCPLLKAVGEMSPTLREMFGMQSATPDGDTANWIFYTEPRDGSNE